MSPVHRHAGAPE